VYLFVRVESNSATEMYMLRGYQPDDGCRVGRTVEYAMVVGDNKILLVIQG
jgi:hypothetical protein